MANHQKTTLIHRSPNSHHASLKGMTQSLWKHRQLLAQFTKRALLHRYKGSYLNLFWSFLNPLAMLLVYTFVFSVIFRPTWQTTDSNSHIHFALILFAGLIPYNLFMEAILAAPESVVNHPNFVKKVIFPLELLPLSRLGAAVVHSLLSLLILLAAVLVILGKLPWTLIFLPVIYLPLLFFCAGLSWILASIGVFIRDIGHLLEIIVRLLFFMSPIVYPIAAIPPDYRFIIYINPLTFFVDHFQQTLIFGEMIDFQMFALVFGGAFGIFVLGYMWFMKSKQSFADVM